MAAIYLASRYGRRLEMLEYVGALERMDHTITSTWIDGHHETRPGIDKDATPEEMAVWAAEDVADVQRCDWLVCFTDGRPGRGGKDAEFGMALALGKRCYVVGPIGNVFHCLPQVRVFPTWNAFLQWHAFALVGRLERATQHPGAPIVVRG